MPNCLICGKQIDGDTNAFFEHVEMIHFNSVKCLNQKCESKTFSNEEMENHQKDHGHILVIDEKHEEYIKNLIDKVCNDSIKQTLAEKKTTTRNGSTTSNGSSSNKPLAIVSPSRNESTLAPSSAIVPLNVPVVQQQPSSSSTVFIPRPTLNITDVETRMLFPKKMRKMLPSESTNYETFDEMVDKCNFISDKSLFIKYINQWNVMFGLPPGRGKTMLLTMALAFYKLRDQQPIFQRDHFDMDTAKYQFKIMEDNRLMQFHQKYPVIYISFGNVKADSFEDIIIEMAETICRAFHDHICGNGNECQKLEGNFKSYHAYGGDEEVRKNAQKILPYWHKGLSSLASLLRKCNECTEKAIVLIDDYDKPLQQAILMEHITQNEIDRIEKRILRLIGFTIEDKTNIERVIVMGNYRLRIDSIKSSFGIIDFPRIEYFYFTKDEFNQLCDRFDVANEYIEAAQRYYNGYTNTNRHDLFLMLSTGNFFNKIAGGKRASLISTESKTPLPPMDCHFVEPDIIKFFEPAFLKVEINDIIRQLARRDIVDMQCSLKTDGDYFKESIMKLHEINADNFAIDKNKVDEFQTHFMCFLLATGCIIEVEKGKYMVPNEEMRDLLCSKIKTFLGTIYGIKYHLIDDLSNQLFELLRTDIDSEEKQFERIPELDNALTSIVQKLPDFADIRQFSSNTEEGKERIIRGNEHIIHSIIDIASIRMPRTRDTGWKKYGSDHPIKTHPWPFELVRKKKLEEIINNKELTKPDVTFLRWNGQLGITIELKYNRLSKNDDEPTRMQKMKKFLAQIGEQYYLQFYEDHHNDELKKLIAIAITVEKFGREKPFALAVMASRNRGELQLEQFTEKFSLELIEYAIPRPERIMPPRKVANRKIRYYDDS